MERGKKIFLIVIVIFLLLVSAFLVIELNKPYQRQPLKNSSLYVPQKSVNVTLDNFAQVVSKNEMIQALPEDAAIKLVFYEGEKEAIFILKKGLVTKGDLGSVDMTISLPLSYMDGLTDRNFCEVIKKSKQDGFFFYSSNKTTTSLLWKYRSMMNYRDCLGF